MLRKILMFTTVVLALSVFAAGGAGEGAAQAGKTVEILLHVCFDFDGKASYAEQAASENAFAGCPQEQEISARGSGQFSSCVINKNLHNAVYTPLISTIRIDNVFFGNLPYNISSFSEIAAFPRTCGTEVCCLRQFMGAGNCGLEGKPSDSVYKSSLPRQPPYSEAQPV